MLRRPASYFRLLFQGSLSGGAARRASFLAGVFSVLFFLLTTLPGLQMIFGFSKEEPLHGVEQTIGDSFPKFSLSSFFAEDFQKSVNTWFNGNLGYRPDLIRSDNQLNFSVFGEISSNYASPLVLGRRNTLFEKLYIDSYSGRWYLREKALERVVKKLAELHRLLKARGIVFTVLITPSKAAIYPEDIPRKYRNRNFDYETQSNYHRFIPLLEKYHVPYVDGHRLAAAFKVQSSFPVFAKGGTHWTEYTACKVSQVLLEQISRRGNKQLPLLRCEPIEMKSIPEPFDRDLADLCNLWNALPLYETLPYPLPSASASATSPADQPAAVFHPQMLFVGGSFLWSVFHYLDAQNIYSSRDMWYYYSRQFHFPGDEIQPLDKGHIDWEQRVFGKDVVVLEVNESSIHQIGSGFISDALTALRKAAPKHGSR
jgi:hypothetical protein